MRLHPIFDTDGYKPSQWLQYPPSTTYMHSYLESRGGRYGQTVFFGLQYIMEEYLTMELTKEMVDEAKEIYEGMGAPFNYDGWMTIVTKHKGKLPVRIRAVAEGTVVPTSNILMSIESTGGPDTFWVVGWLETMLLRVWYPTTVATQSWHIRKIIKEFLDRTTDDTNADIAFKLHDFGSRSVSSQESSGIGGLAHAAIFKGSDTTSVVKYARQYYMSKNPIVTIPASEHSTMTSWEKSNEVEAYRNMIKQFGKPGGIFACVCDSYDHYNAVENLWGKELKGEIINSGATLVVRPDSGDPTEIVLKTVQLLDKQFGSSYNSKGYKVLNNVRVIQGDGINEDEIRSILRTLCEAGYSATNVAFGMGGALLQQVNRDTQKFAFKCSEVTVTGHARDVYKDPITDQGKRSKRGRLDLIKRIDRKFETVRGQDNLGTVMPVVYEDGAILRRSSLEEIRKKASE